MSTEVDDCKTRRPARVLGRAGPVIGVIGPSRRLFRIAPALDWFLLLGCSASIACAALLGSGCATKPFNVKSRLAAPPAGFTGRAAAGAIELEAAVIRDEDYLQTTFDANLIMAGIFPVKLVLLNGGTAPVSLESMHFSLSAGEQRKTPMEPRDAFKRLMGYYKIRAYSMDGYKASLGDFVSYGFDLRVPLPPGESRWGVLFFGDPADLSPGSPLVLSVRGIGATEVTLSLK